MDASCEEIDRAFRALAKVQHPDAGGRREVFAVTQQAYEAARRERRCA
jgi:curved DNA-binding protein CbpA